MGVGLDGEQKAGYEAGIDIKAKYMNIGEAVKAI